MSSRALRQVSSSKSKAPVEDDIEDSEEDELLVAAPRKSFNAFAAVRPGTALVSVSCRQLLPAFFAEQWEKRIFVLFRIHCCVCSQKIRVYHSNYGLSLMLQLMKAGSRCFALWTQSIHFMEIVIFSMNKLSCPNRRVETVKSSVFKLAQHFNPTT